MLTRKDIPPPGPLTAEWKALGWVEGDVVLNCFIGLRAPPEKPQRGASVARRKTRHTDSPRG
jgi:hypothetical protein